jgi:hypothetical protein
MGNQRYILDQDRERPVPCPDLMTWARWWAAADQRGIRKVGATQVGDVMVSTVFLGLDHRFGFGAPLLWETMSFSSDGESLDCWRCGGNREQAEAQHAEVVASYSGPIKEIKK